MNTVKINFGGFYRTYHESIIEDNMQSGEDYSTLINDYADRYIDKLNNELGTDLVYMEVQSPKEYNFITDVIVCSFTNEDVIAIRRFIQEHALGNYVIERCGEATTPISGYTPYHTFEQLVRNAHLFLECKLDVIIAHLEYDYPFVVEHL